MPRCDHSTKEQGYGKLLGCLERPALYEQGASIWTDSHISQQLLQAHLNPEADGASRKHSFMDSSAAWIAQAAPPGAYPRLLDVGCGPGLYAQRFCRAGYTVTGVDFSRRSVAYAQQAAEAQELPIRYICADYLQMNMPPEAYDIAVFIYCDYGALPPAHRQCILQKIHHALRPGGRLLLDVFAPAHYAAFAEERYWKLHDCGGFWSDGQHVELVRNEKYGQGVTLEQTAVLTGDSAQCYHLWNSHFSPKQLAEEAAQAGFRDVGVFGDVAGAPYTPESPTLALMLEK